MMNIDISDAICAVNFLIAVTDLILKMYELFRTRK